MKSIRDTLSGTVTVDGFKGKYDNPGQHFVDACNNAENWCRWIFEFAVNENSRWDTDLIPYIKAKDQGFKGSWWKQLGGELEEMKGTKRRAALASAASPFVKLFAQFDKVDALFSRGQPAKG